MFSLYALTIHWLVEDLKTYARGVSLPLAPRTLMAKWTERGVPFSLMAKYRLLSCLVALSIAAPAIAVWTDCDRVPFEQYKQAAPVLPAMIH